MLFLLNPKCCFFSLSLSLFTVKVLPFIRTTKPAKLFLSILYIPSNLNVNKPTWHEIYKIFMTQLFMVKIITIQTQTIIYCWESKLSADLEHNDLGTSKSCQVYKLCNLFRNNHFAHKETSVFDMYKHNQRKQIMKPFYASVRANLNGMPYINSRFATRNLPATISRLN